MLRDVAESGCHIVGVLADETGPAFAYSIGVLHHTPAPANAFARVADTVQPGGKLAVYMYARYGPSHRVSDAIRVVTTRLPLKVMWVLSAVAIPLYYPYRLPILGKLSGLKVGLENVRWQDADIY